MSQSGLLEFFCELDGFGGIISSLYTSMNDTIELIELYCAKIIGDNIPQMMQIVFNVLIDVMYGVYVILDW